MSWNNKVVWNEGLFMRPQLFQQQERYFEHFAHKRAMPLSPFFFGFTHYSLDAEALALGKVILKSASGIFQDGTPFDVPSDTPLPDPLTIQPEHLEQIIYLAAPIRVPNGEETTFDDTSDSLARYSVFNTELRDTNSIGGGLHTIQLSTLRLRLVPEKEMTKAWIGLALTRVKTIEANASITLDETIVPPVSVYGASQLITSWLATIHGLTQLRAKALAERLTGANGNASAAEISDYLLLQTLNYYEMHLQHIQHVPGTSPADLYALLLGMAGDLSTYVRPATRRPLGSYPAYDHIHQHLSIKPVIDDLQLLLNAVLLRSAQRIELNDVGYGMYNAVVDLAELKGFTAMVLAVSAAMPPEVLQQHFLAQAKLGSSNRLPDLVHTHLPGLTIRAMPVAPRQIPFHTGYIYYELVRTGQHWEEIESSGGLGLHIAGDFPGLKLELWGGIREK